MCPAHSAPERYCCTPAGLYILILCQKVILRTHLLLKPEQDGFGESHGREQDTGVPVVAGRNTPPVIWPAEHDLNAVAALVATLVVANGFGPGFAPRYAGRDALCLQSVAEPVGIIAPVAQQPLRSGQAVQQGAPRRCNR